jgi:hypothetical protein
VQNITKFTVHVAESDESYDRSAKCAEQSAQNVEKSLNIRTDSDLGNSSTLEDT